MLFNSFTFLAFAPIALLGHLALRGLPLRVWLLVMSYVFYSWANPWYCLLLLTSTVLDYTVALRMSANHDQRRRRAWLALSICGNLGLLGTFKYLGFFSNTVNELGALLHLDLSLPIPHILLPVGISFYTFQTMAYTIDVYRGQVQATRSFTTMALYVAYFPQLVAGPIERAGRLMGQLAEKKPRTIDDILAGVTRVLWGLLKKVVFADWLSVFVNNVYAHPARATTTPDLLLATYAFAFQIYLDFSAYSDIAIGTARIMGVRLMENFAWPYLSRNIAEFWRRWHISLSTWLRDYLYVALGGSRKGIGRTVLNVIIVMFLGGLWHGANEKFVIWGLWLGLALGLYHTYAAVLSKRQDPDRPFRWSDVPAILVTFHVVLFSWVFFRANSATQGLYILERFFGPWGRLDFLQPTEDVIRTSAIIVLAALAHVARGTRMVEKLEQQTRRPILIGAFWGLLVVMMALFFAPVRARFIYFQF